MNTRCPEQMGQLFTRLDTEDDLEGIVNCWPLDICDALSVDENHQLGAFTTLRLVKALAEHDTIKARLYLITANAQPAPGTPLNSVDQAAIWGLGRVIGHQEFSEYWGGLIDIDVDTLRPPTALKPPHASASTFSTTAPKIRSRSAAKRRSSRVCARATA